MSEIVKEAEYREALKQCFSRYDEMNTEPALESFLAECFQVVDEYPIPKLCRWLGYIQGVLIERKVTTLQEERDWTRPLFRPLDFYDSNRV